MSRKTSRLRRRLIWEQEGLCFYCGTPMLYIARGPFGATLDHVIPQAADGPTHWVNTVAAHSCCNTAKADRPPTQDELLRLILQKSKEPA